MNEEVADKLDRVVEKAVDAAEIAVQRPAIHRIARLGFYAKGFLFLVIGSLAIMLAIGLREGRIADPTGALAVIANQPFGTLLLLGFAVGAAGHGLWNLLRAIADVDNAGGNWLGILKRSIAAGIGLFYLGLALTAIEKLLSARVAETPSQAEETFISVLLAVPLLGAALLVITVARSHRCRISRMLQRRKRKVPQGISGLGDLGTAAILYHCPRRT